MITPRILLFLFMFGLCVSAQAEVSLPNIFGDHMVLQRGQSNPVWGRADAGEGRDIHPRDKQTVANRLVRHALAKDYGFDVVSESPRFASMTVSGSTATIKFDHVDEGLRAFDIEEVQGFSIAGADQAFVWADATIVGKDTVEVSSDLVPDPVAVRYAWATNPVANLQDRNGLPVTPFRTDEWTGVTE
jgi:sialate O-acetylesterase